MRKYKTTLERGRCPVPNLLRMPFVGVGLDWARPSSSSTLIALIKLLLRLRSQVRIGVRAVGKTNQRAYKEEEALQRKHTQL